MKNEIAYRQLMGERLKAFRLEQGLSAYKVAQRGGININQVPVVETGDTNYTIDTFLGYIRGCDLYMYFATKGDDPRDLITKGVENYPG